MAQLSRWFGLMSTSKCSPTTPKLHATLVWALPFSLATTWGIIIIFFSCGYLDVSVLRVGFSLQRWLAFSQTGCPIRKSSDITLVCSSPKLIAAYHVLHRLIDPRHPPYALICFKKVYSVLDPHTISKVQRRRPLVFNITIKHVYLSYILLLTTLFSQYVKELVFNEPWTVNNEPFHISLKFDDVKGYEPFRPLRLHLTISKRAFCLMNQL